MAMYAIATQAWFADDATAGGQIQHLHEWWTKLQNSRPSYGY